jgi:tetratricopeptide (TPR) repeat protein
MGLSVMELNLGNLEKAKAYAEQALTLSQQLGDTWGVAYSQMMIGNALAESRELARAVPMFEEAIRLFRALDDEHYALIATGNLAWVVEELGDKKRGRALRQEVVLAARAHGNQRMEASMLSELGMTAYDADRLEEAAVMLRQAIEINHRTGDTRSLALDLGRLAAVLAKKDKPDAAARILSKSVGIFDGLNATRPWWASDRDEKTLDILKNQLTEETLGRIWDEGRRLSVDEAVELALSDA